MPFLSSCFYWQTQVQSALTLGWTQLVYLPVNDECEHKSSHSASEETESLFVSTKEAQVTLSASAPHFNRSVSSIDVALRKLQSR